MGDKKDRKDKKLNLNDPSKFEKFSGVDVEGYFDDQMVGIQFGGLGTLMMSVEGAEEIHRALGDVIKKVRLYGGDAERN